MIGKGIAHGKFGELLQGALPDEDGHFLVTLPVSCFSRAEIRFSAVSPDIFVYPTHKTKSYELVKKITNFFGISGGWELRISSEIEEGKGLGSSSADLVACARAVENALDKKIPIDVLLSFLREIEPSDGLMYEEAVCFYHRKVILHTKLECWPNLAIVGVDEGGVIDTVEFNKQLQPYNLEQKNEYAQLLESLIKSIRHGDLKTIGKISTRSAVLHQAINPKKHLNYFIDLCQISDAIGVIVAHSGTYIGLMLDVADPGYEQKLCLVEDKLKAEFLTYKLFKIIANPEFHEFIKNT